MEGAVCSYGFLFTPAAADFLAMPIGEGIGLISGDDRGKIGELIFQSFVEATTDKNLRIAETLLNGGVIGFCSKAENEKFCKLK